MKKYLVTIVTLLLAAIVAPAWSAQKANEQKVAEDLRTAFKNETTESTMYAAYAKKAREEGLQKIAVLFEAVSKADNIHASNHEAALRQLGEPTPSVQPDFNVGSTKENLENAINVEANGLKAYPGFITDAKQAMVYMAEVSFNYSYETGLKHKAFFQYALNALDNNNLASLATSYQVCSTCGNTYPGQGPKRCGICMTSMSRDLAFNVETTGAAQHAGSHLGK